MGILDFFSFRRKKENKNKSDNWPIPFGPKFDAGAHVYEYTFSTFIEVLLGTVFIADKKKYKYNIMHAASSTLSILCVTDYMYNKLGSNKYDDTKSFEKYANIVFNRLIQNKTQWLATMALFIPFLDCALTDGDMKEIFFSADFHSLPYHTKFVALYRNDTIKAAFNQILNIYFSRVK